MVLQRVGRRGRANSGYGVRAAFSAWITSQNRLSRGRIALAIASISLLFALAALGMYLSDASKRSNVKNSESEFAYLSLSPSLLLAPVLH